MSETRNFSTSFIVDQTPEEVFAAVINVRGWWSRALLGNSAAIGDEFEYRHGDIHYSKHQLIKVIPDKRVEWLTLDSKLTFVDQTNEWNDTIVVFEIEEIDDKTKLTFTHRGLTPSLACFEGCSGGWRYYISSLHQLITTGKGSPDEQL